MKSMKRKKINPKELIKKMKKEYLEKWEHKKFLLFYKYVKVWF